MSKVKYLSLFSILMLCLSFYTKEEFLIIKFQDVKPKKGFIILQNNREEFQIEFAKYEKYRKFYIEKSHFVKIERKKLVESFLEGDSALNIYYFDTQQSLYKRYRVNTLCDTFFIGKSN